MIPVSRLIRALVPMAFLFSFAAGDVRVGYDNVLPPPGAEPGTFLSPAGTVGNDGVGLLGQPIVDGPVLLIESDGTGLSASQALAFGDVTAGSSKTLTISLINKGTLPLKIAKTEILGTNPADFWFDSRPAALLAPDSQTQCRVTFHPRRAGARAAHAEVLTNTGKFRINFGGTGTGTDYANLDVATAQGVPVPSTLLGPSTPLVIGEDLEQGEPAAVSLRLWNRSLVDDRLFLTGNVAVSIAGPNASEFALQAIPSGQILRNSYKTLTITGTPQGPGARTATVTVHSSDEDQPVWTFDIEMAARQTREIAVDGPTGIGIWDGDGNPSAADGTDFGEADTEYGKKIVRFAVKSVGDPSTQIELDGNPRVKLLGLGAGSFSVKTQPGSPIAGGESTFFEIEFDPAKPGTQTAIVSIDNNDDNEDPFDFAISGRGTAPLAEAMLAGYTPVSSEVEESGAFTQSISIEVPPGTAGMVPSLGLGYQHRIPNGLLGVGAELSGMSAITRGSRSLAQDGRIDAITFDATDQFFLDGQRLQLVGGTHGADGAEYRTERDPFARIRIVGAQNGGPREWTVETKAGQKLFYGTTEDSRVEAKDSLAVLTWALARVEDTAGNYLLWSYDEDNDNGAFYPDAIAYTGNAARGLLPYNRVEFEWDARLDDLPRFVAGSEVRYERKLSAIRTYAEGNLVRSYVVGYEQSPSSFRTRMLQVQEVAGDGSFYPPTRFEWSDATFQPQFLRNQSVGADPALSFQADMDGDGRTDIVLPQGTGVRILFMRPGGVEERIFQTDDFWGTPGTYSRPNGIADFDADGIADIYSVVGGQFLIRKTRPAAGNFHEEDDDTGDSDNRIPHGTSATWAMPGDFNADGRSDLAFVWKPAAGPTTMSIWYSGIGTNELRAYEVPEWTWTGSENMARTLRTMDVNGDGITDVVNNANSTVQIRIARFSNEGDPSFEQATWPSTLAGGLVGDYNNDGLVDLMMLGGLEPSQPDVDARLAYMNLSTARAFEDQEWDVPNIFESEAVGGRLRTKVADVNGDQLSDIVVVRPGSQIAYLLLSTGRAFRRQDVVLPAPWPGGELAIGDFDGNGLADISSMDGGYVVALTTVFPDLVVATTTGLGARTEVVYKPITDASVYAKQTGAIYPEVDIQNALQVVATVSEDDGKGGRYFVDHKYSGARVHLHGRGFLGFQSIESADRQTGRGSRTTFLRDFPFEGLASASEEFVGDKFVAKTVNTYDKVEYGSDSNKRYFVFLKRSIQEAFEINHALPQSVVVRTQTDNVWDSAYGDLLETTTEVRGQSASDRHFKITKNTYAANDSGGRPWVDAVRWMPGRLSRASVTHKSTGKPDVVRTSAFGYSAANGLLATETVEPDLPQFLVNTAYARDGFGNIVSTTISGGSGATAFTPRTSTATYDAKGRFPLSARNPLNQQTSAEFDARFGAAVVEVDVNGHRTTRQLDSFGREIRADLPDGTWRTRTFEYVADEARPYLSYQLRTDAAGQPPVTVRMDLLGREVETETVGFRGQRLLSRKEYNGRGQLVRECKPFHDGDPIHWSTAEYDAIDRAIRQVAPDGATVRSVYDGLTTTARDPYDIPTVTVRDSMNRVASVTDVLDQTVFYKYDATDNLVEIEDHDGNVTSAQFDIRGRRIQTSDPNMGTWSYQYNALGELVRQTDARGQSVDMQYDLLGRMSRRTEPEGATDWTYDTASAGVGLPASVEQNHAGHAVYRETYAYDGLSRPSVTTRRIDGQNYAFRTTYDAVGRPDKLEYPTGGQGSFAVRNNYNEFQHLASIAGVEDGTVYWNANAINAVGQVAEETLGNGIVVRRAYDPKTDRLLGIESGVGAASSDVQELEYVWDLVGNLTSRRDERAAGGNHEEFAYDFLYRLQSSRTGLLPASYQTKTFGYAGNGNIASKSDVGTYHYAGAGPHRVTSVDGGFAGTLTMGYDANGNATSWAGRTVAWNSWNMAASISAGAASAAFLYGPDRMRYRMDTVGAGGAATTVYVGRLYEKFLKGAETTDRYFVFAGESRVATVEFETAEKTVASPALAGTDGDQWMIMGESLSPAAVVKTTTKTVRYLLKDHLGSSDVVTDDAGVVVERLSFDPWGRRRMADAPTPWNDAPSPIIPTTTNRGFTDHEHLDELGLVNMNGRIYDPLLGRFLSADPFVQQPYNLQNLNRYSYVLNNPLSLVDPSGFFLKKLFKAIKRVVRAVVDFVKENWRTILAIAVNYFLPGIGTAITTALSVPTAIASYVAVGIQSFATGLIATGSVRGALRSGFLAAVGAALPGDLGSFIQNPRGYLSDQFMKWGFDAIGDNITQWGLAKIVAHGVVGGVGNVIGGGSFKDGFVAAAAAQTFSGAISRNFGYGNDSILAASLIGGAAARLAGGSFSDGFRTGSYSRLYNCNAHPSEEGGTGTKAAKPEIGDAVRNDSGLCAEWGDFEHEWSLFNNVRYQDVCLNTGNTPWAMDVRATLLKMNRNGEDVGTWPHVKVYVKAAWRHPDGFWKTVGEALDVVYPDKQPSQ